MDEIVYGSERIDKDGKKILVVEEMEQIPCPMHEDYDDVDYKAKDEWAERKTYSGRAK